MESYSIVLTTGFTLNTLLHSDATGDATVLQTHRYTPSEQLKINCLQADIVIVACGKNMMPQCTELKGCLLQAFPN